VSWPGPIHVSEECDEEYEVDYIVASHIYKKQLQDLVHWKGYEEHERTWEPLSNLKNSPLVVERFYRENPSAPRKLRMAQADFDSLFSRISENLRASSEAHSRVKTCVKNPEKNLLPDDSSAATSKQSSNSPSR